MTTTVSILPSEINLELQAGTDNQIQFQLTSDDDSLVPLDISNDAVKFTAKIDFGGPVAIATKTNNVGEHDDPTNGKTTFLIDKTEIDDETLVDAATSWVYEVRRVEPGGEELVYIFGDLILCPSVGTS